MKRLICTISVVALVLGIAMPAVAQVTGPIIMDPKLAPDNGITGNLKIGFGTRQERNKDERGVLKYDAADLYDLDIFAGNTVRMQGQIKYQAAHPGIPRDNLPPRPQMLSYNIAFTAYRTSDWKSAPAGQLSGRVPISSENKYIYDNGDLRAEGRGLRSPSPFRGIALGKPPEVKKGLLSRARQEVELRVGKYVKGEALAVAVKSYDKMGFPNGVTLAAGPVEEAYPLTVVTGTMLYDRIRTAWYFRVEDVDMTMSYTLGTTPTVDRLGGTILWTEKPRQGNSRDGFYTFDVRLNDKEVKASEAKLFEEGKDESLFFEPDLTSNTLSGKMFYVDKFEGETVVSSDVTIQLVGNNWKKHQLMNFAKVFMLSAIIPVNSE